MENRAVENKGNYSLGRWVEIWKKTTENQINVFYRYCSERSEVRTIRKTKIGENKKRRHPIRLNILTQFLKDV